MIRFERRKALLDGKRRGAVDPDQYFFDKAVRTRLHRKLRIALRRGAPVVLVTPRWSSAPRFLDDVAVDLSLGEPALRARPLSLLPLKGLSQHQAWAWIAGAVAEFCQLPFLDGPAWQAVSRRGFRTVLAELFDRAEGERRRLIMLHGLEHANVEAVHDLFDVFRAHVDKHGDERTFNLLFAGSIDAPHFQMDGAVRLELVDFAEDEAMEALVEYIGPIEQHRLKSIIAMVGGVPAILDGLGQRSADDLTRVLSDRDEMWRALGHLAEEVRSAIDIVNADDGLAQRLEGLAREGSLPIGPLDERLQRAGLVLMGPVRSRLRTPWFADLILAG